MTIQAQAPTLTPEFIKRFLGFVDLLSARWIDEYKHEKIEDYATQIETVFPEVSSVKITKATKKWKTVSFTKGEFNYRVDFKGRQLQLVRLA